RDGRGASGVGRRAWQRPDRRELEWLRYTCCLPGVGGRRARTISTIAEIADLARRTHRTRRGESAGRLLRGEGAADLRWAEQVAYQQGSRVGKPGTSSRIPAICVEMRC